MKFGIGQPVRRREDTRLLRGAGRYIDDISLPGQARAVLLRSPVSHGRITRLEVAAARGLPGVLAVWTAAEVAGRLQPLGPVYELEPPPAPVGMAHLAEEMVRFVGQPVAFVVAETQAQAQDAAEAIELDIDELEPVTDPEAALAPGAPQLHPEAPGNLAYRREIGDAAATEALGRPVRWVGERTESFLADTQGRDMRARVEGAFDSGGVCLAMRIRTVSGLGAYLSNASVMVHSAFSARLLGGAYRVQATHAAVRGAFTTTTPMDAYLGAGRPEIAHATERLMDQAAREFGADPAEFRRRNLLTAEMLPHRSPGDYLFDSLDPARVMDHALARADYAGFEARAAAARGRGCHAGIGVIYAMERTGGAPIEHARIRLTPDGRLQVWVGTQDTGQGHATTWAQVLREQLGLDFAQIEVMAGDSDALPAGGNTGGSRSTIMAGRVLLRAADDMIA